MISQWMWRTEKDAYNDPCAIGFSSRMFQRGNTLSRGEESPSPSHVHSAMYTHTHPHTHPHTHTHTHRVSSNIDALAIANSDDKIDRPPSFLITAAPYLLLRPNCIRHRHGLFLVALLFLICLNSTNSIRCAAPVANRIRAWVTRFFMLSNSARDWPKERSTCRYQWSWFVASTSSFNIQFHSVDVYFFLYVNCISAYDRSI